jgi:sugar phosphate isomerase/epimerase
MSPAQAKLGVCIDDLRLPGPEAIQQAARMGYRAIQIGTVASEFEPQRFCETARRHLRRFVNDQNLEIAALLVDIGGLRFGDPARLEEGIDRTVAAIQMAAQMHVPIVAVELGPVVPEDTHIEQSLRQLAQTCDSTGTFLALQTGYTDPEEMARMIRNLGGSTLRACYDPAALLLGGFEALPGIGPPAGQIILAYVRDAIAGRGSQSGGGRAPQGRETALGEGELDLAEYLAALQEAGHFVPLIVRRTQAMHPVVELSKAKEALEAVVR